MELTQEQLDLMKRCADLPSIEQATREQVQEANQIVEQLARQGIYLNNDGNNHWGWYDQYSQLLAPM